MQLRCALLEADKKREVLLHLSREKKVEIQERIYNQHVRLLIVLQGRDLEREISTVVARAAAVEIALYGMLMKFPVGSIEWQPAGIPLLRVSAPNTRCLEKESRAAGYALFPQRTLRCRVARARLYYKDFAGTKLACVTMS